nr:immunoglobulin heavy chain junction region [Macaca mulatta]
CGRVGAATSFPFDCW